MGKEKKSTFVSKQAKDESENKWNRKSVTNCKICLWSADKPYHTLKTQIAQVRSENGDSARESHRDKKNLKEYCNNYTAHI